jgi:hypothetical protein
MRSFGTFLPEQRSNFNSASLDWDIILVSEKAVNMFIFT